MTSLGLQSRVHPAIEIHRTSRNQAVLSSNKLLRRTQPSIPAENPLVAQSSLHEQAAPKDPTACVQDCKDSSISTYGTIISQETSSRAKRLLPHRPEEPLRWSCHHWSYNIRYLGRLLVECQKNITRRSRHRSIYTFRSTFAREARRRLEPLR